MMRLSLLHFACISIFLVICEVSSGSDWRSVKERKDKSTIEKRDLIRKWRGRKNECQCGIRKPSFGIIGGQRTRQGEFPWQISIRVNDEHYCGGSLISDQWILTAAHCVEPYMNVESGIIAAGSSNIRRGRNQQIRNVEEIISHDGYTYTGVEDRISGEYLNLPLKDIALIKVDRKFDFNEYIQPICLPFHLEDRTFEDENVELSGWGRFLRSSRITSPILYKIIMRILPDADCREERVGGAYDQSQICAEGGSPKGACHGDSGGPMAYEVRPNQFTQVGVVSYGFPECHQASMYTRVTSYLDWIVENTGVDDFCKPF